MEGGRKFEPEHLVKDCALLGTNSRKMRIVFEKMVLSRLTSLSTSNQVLTLETQLKLNNS